MAWLEFVREIPDFPRPGILFRDVLPVMANPAAWREVVGALSERIRPLDVDVIVAPEARGFLVAGAVADRLGAGIVPVRKPGKLPRPVLAQRYTLEYGESQLEVEAQVRYEGRRAVIVDDVLATGGTVEATAKLMAGLGVQVVAYAFLIELAALAGRQRLAGGTADIISLAVL